MKYIHTIVMALFCILGNSAWAEGATTPALPPVVVDGRTKTTASTDATGHVTVQIAPVATGVTGDISHNSYSNFNIPKAGLDLDNRTVDARIIINEVTSSNPSLIQGQMEVLGNRAHVILANPNGITVDGGKFVNTGGLALTTGSISYADDQVTPITVQRNPIITTNKGTITIEGDGMAGLFTNLELIAKEIAINGPVTNTQTQENAKLQLIAGSTVTTLDSSVSVVNSNTSWIKSLITPLENDNTATLINMGPLGSLSASRILVAVTDKGAGVKLAGDLASSAKEITLDAQGNINLTGSTITSATHTVITSTNDITLAGTTITAGTVNSDNTTVDSSGAVSLSSENITIAADTTGGTAVGSTISATSSILLTASDDTHIEGSALSALADINIAAGSFTNEGIREGNSWLESRLEANGGLLIETSTGSIINHGGTLQGDERIADNEDSLGGVTLISAGSIENKTMASDALGIIFATDDDLSLHARDDISNNTGRLLSNANLSVISDEGDFNNFIEKEIIANAGIRENYSYKDGSFLFKTKKVSGWRVSYGDLLIDGASATISAGDDLTIQAANITNNGGDIYAQNGAISLEATGSFTNTAMLSGTAYIQSNCGWSCRTKGNSSYTKTGANISASGKLALSAKEGVTNTGGEILSSASDVIIDSPKEVINNDVPVYDFETMARGIKSIFKGNYGRMMSSDQGGNITANMGYVTINSDMPVIMNGGVITAEHEDIAMGVETVKVSITSPSQLTGNSTGLFDSLLMY